MSISSVSGAASALATLKTGTSDNATPSSGSSASSSSAAKTVVSTTTVSDGNGNLVTTITYSDGTTDVSTSIDDTAQRKSNGKTDLSKKSALGNLLDPSNVDQKTSLLSSQEDKSS
jgi:hypothetical protein